MYSLSRVLNDDDDDDDTVLPSALLSVAVLPLAAADGETLDNIIIVVAVCEFKLRAKI